MKNPIKQIWRKMGGKTKAERLSYYADKLDRLERELNALCDNKERICTRIVSLTDQIRILKKAIRKLR